MASSKVSCMLVSLLLLVLVLSDMDKALGEPIRLRNRKLISSFFRSRTPEELKKFFERVKIPQELMGLCVNNEECKKKMKNGSAYLKAKPHSSSIWDTCGYNKKCQLTLKNASAYLKAKPHPSSIWDTCGYNKKCQLTLKKAIAYWKAKSHQSPKKGKNI